MPKDIPLFNKVMIIILSPVIILHELCHFVTAWLLGVREMEINLTRVSPGKLPDNWNNKRWIIVSLAPTAVGLACLPFIPYPFVPFFIVTWFAHCTKDWLDSIKKSGLLRR